MPVPTSYTQQESSKDSLPLWQTVGARKRKERGDSIPVEWKLPAGSVPKGAKSLLTVPRTCGILSPREINLTEDYDAVGLTRLIKEKASSSEEIVTAFCKRAAIAHQLINCLTEIFFEQAIVRARRLDQERRSHPDLTLAPLHGLPISLKDSFKVQGLDSSIGIAALAGNPAKSNSALINILLKQGAVLYCKTNLGQLMISCDTDNNVFGRTLNPNNTSISSGGSTGGEAALIALHGSVLGVGSDLGGSIRGPSSANGVYCFKPSADIVPYAGQQSPNIPDIPVVVPSAGPLATSIQACQLFMEAVMTAEPWQFDISSLRMPHRAVVAPERQLRIACLVDDKANTPTPPLRRAMEESMEKLRQEGHSVSVVDLGLDVTALQKLVLGTFPLDGNKEKNFLRLLELTEEPAVPSVARMGLKQLPRRSLSEISQLFFARHQARLEWHKMWQRGQYDILITFVAPHTAVPLDTWTNINLTGLFNLLDCPTCVLPVGKVQASDRQDQAARYGPADEALYKLYTGPDDYKDVPICLQAVGARQDDENFLAVAAVVDSILRKGRNSETENASYAAAHNDFRKAFRLDLVS